MKPASRGLCAVQACPSFLGNNVKNKLAAGGGVAAGGTAAGGTAGGAARGAAAKGGVAGGQTVWF